MSRTAISDARANFRNQTARTKLAHLTTHAPSANPAAPAVIFAVIFVAVKKLRDLSRHSLFALDEKSFMQPRTTDDLARLCEPRCPLWFQRLPKSSLVLANYLARISG